MAPMTCALTLSGHTAVPQSMAHQTRCAFTSPFDTDASTTCATMLLTHSANAIPRCRPAGGGSDLRRHLGNSVQRRQSARAVAQQPPAELVGFLPDLVRKLVDEALHEEAVLGGAHRPPGPAWDMVGLVHRLRREVLDGILLQLAGRLRRFRGQAEDGTRVIARGERDPACPELRNGRADDPDRHGAGQAVPQHRLDPGRHHGTVEAVLHVLLAGPDELHRTVDGFGDQRRLLGIVQLEFSPEFSAQERRVHLHLRRRKPRQPGTKLRHGRHPLRGTQYSHLPSAIRTVQVIVSIVAW